MKNKIIILLGEKNKLELRKPNITFAKNFNSILSINNYILKLLLFGLILFLFPIALLSPNMTKTFLEIGLVLFCLFSINKILSKQGVIPQFSYDLAIFGFTSLVALSLLYNSIIAGNNTSSNIQSMGLEGSVMFVFVLIYIAMISIYNKKQHLETLLSLLFLSGPLMFLLAWLYNIEIPESLLNPYLLLLPGTIWFLTNSDKHRILSFVNYILLILAFSYNSSFIFISILTLVLGLNVLFAVKLLGPIPQKGKHAKKATSYFNIFRLNKTISANRLVFFILFCSIPVLILLIRYLKLYPGIIDVSTIVDINSFAEGFEIVKFLVGSGSLETGSLFKMYVTGYGVISLMLLLIVFAQVIAKTIQQVKKTTQDPVDPFNVEFPMLLTNFLVLFLLGTFIFVSNQFSFALGFLMLSLWVIYQNQLQNKTSSEWGETYKDFKFLKTPFALYFAKFLQTCAILFIIIIVINAINFLELLTF